MAEQKVMSNTLKKQGVFFVIVGSLAALVHFIALIILVQWVQLSPNWANCTAFVIAFLVGFTGHLNYTFRHQHEEKDWKSKLVKWFASSVCGFALNQVIFASGISWLGAQYYVPIWIVATGVVTVCTFILAKFWAFKTGKTS